MSLPFEYDQLAVGEFGGTTPTTTDFANARVVILPVPLDRTTSYVAGTRNGPHEILVASAHMELWDEETQTDVHSVGIFTLPEMEFPQSSKPRRRRPCRPRFSTTSTCATIRSGWTGSSTRSARPSTSRSTWTVSI